MTTLPTQLGPYIIDREIGRGGMGVVYLGQDTTLDRPVAIKALPEHLAGDSDRLARFEREAKMLAQLNHPNVAGIHGVEEHAGARYLILEYVEGPTLSERLDAGPLPVDEAIVVCAQIASGLEAAHDAGVIHRDLKPGNIKITPEGRVKVLDFGLAKTTEGASTTGSSMSQAPTMSTPATPNSPTSPGAILGTAPYMSPEQARGRTLDQRSDIWSFGVVLYECLTGLSPFAGETMSDSIGAILHREPDVSLLPAATPASVRHLLRRCLQRDKAKRLHSIADARIELEDPGEAVEAAAQAKRASPLAMALAAVACLVVGVIATWFIAPMLEEAPTPPMTRRFEFTPASPNFLLPTISPDGSQIAYVVDNQLMIRDLSQLEPRPLATVENRNSMAVFWSPDSQWVGLVDGTQIKRIPAAGGPPITIGVSPVPLLTRTAGADWSEDGRIFFSSGTTTGLLAVPAAGGVPREILAPAQGESDFHEVSVLPGGKGVIFVVHAANGPNSIWHFSEATGRRLLHDAGVRVEDPRYTSTGHIVYERTANPRGIWALPFSLENLQVTGEPFLIAQDISWATVSQRSDLVMPSHGFGTTGAEVLVWVDRSGQVLETVSPELGEIWGPKLSPDGTRIAVQVDSADGDSDIWIVDVERSTVTRLAHEDGDQEFPIWSSDGQRIAYLTPAENRVQSKPTEDLVVRNADGSGAPETLLEHVAYPSLSADWTIAAFEQGPSVGEADIFWQEIGPESPSTPFLQQQALVRRPAIRPGGGFIAYASDESGQDEVYLKPFPDGPGRWQISTDGGTSPHWSPEGDRLFYRGGISLVEVTVDTTTDAARPRLGRPQVLFPEGERLILRRRFVVAPEGEKFLLVARAIVEGETSVEEPTIIVVENWFEEFRSRAAP